MDTKDVTLNEYQDRALKTAIFPKDKILEYCTIALAGEAGEVCEKVKRVLRGDKTLPRQREAIWEFLSIRTPGPAWLPWYAFLDGNDIKVAYFNLVQG